MCAHMCVSVSMCVCQHKGDRKLLWSILLVKLIIIVLSDTSIITMLINLMDSKKGGVVPPSPQQDTGREFKGIDTYVIAIRA